MSAAYANIVGLANENPANFNPQPKARYKKRGRHVFKNETALTSEPFPPVVRKVTRIRDW